jgi:hypothetical protein
MKLSKDVQKDILMEGFQSLKSDYEENYSEISEIIGKMAAIDIEIAMDMWEHILTSNPRFITNNAGYLNDNKAYDITSNVLYNICKSIGDIEAAEIISTRPKVKQIIFGKSANVDSNQCTIIAQYILQGNFEIADEVLKLVKSNKYNKGKGFSMTIGSIFQDIFDRLHSDISENMLEFLYQWIQQLEDPKEKAKANVRFLNLLK